MSEMKPCPFCGATDPELYTVRDGVKVWCTNCHAMGPPEYHGPKTLAPAADRAIACWNERA